MRHRRLLLQHVPIAKTNKLRQKPKSKQQSNKPLKSLKQKAEKNGKNTTAQTTMRRSKTYSKKAQKNTKQPQSKPKHGAWAEIAVEH